MGINSFITHRMFVAALSHDEETSSQNKQPASQEQMRERAKQLSWDAHFSLLREDEKASHPLYLGSAGGI